jgi:hypothetical protein
MDRGHRIWAHILARRILLGTSETVESPRMSLAMPDHPGYSDGKRHLPHRVFRRYCVDGLPRPSLPRAAGCLSSAVFPRTRAFPCVIVDSVPERVVRSEPEDRAGFPDAEEVPCVQKSASGRI